MSYAQHVRCFYFLFFKRLLKSFANNFEANYYADILTSLSFEALFYIGLTTFLVVTECVQRSYVQLSPHRWGLITGLKGYMVSANSKMGLKVFIWSDTAWPASPSRSGSFCGGLCCSTCIWNISLQTWIFSLALVPIIF